MHQGTKKERKDRFQVFFKGEKENLSRVWGWVQIAGLAWGGK